MAKRKRSAKAPQPQHKKKGQPSRHDKRRRLLNPNPNRRRTTRAKVPLVGAMQAAVAALQRVLDRRIAFRLAIIVAGMLLADDRRTASSWFVAAGVQDDWDRFYDCLVSIGRQSQKLATAVLTLIVRKFDPGPEGRILLGVDDSPTARYGRQVEGAGVHHHPTPGPADGEWLYGHNWVTLAWLVTHPLWGVIALPLRSLLYVREVDVPKLDGQRGWKFRTKHELAAELLTWFVKWLRLLGLKARLWLAADGAYAARPFLKPVLALGVTVVSRLRKDAKLFDLPPERKPGKRRGPGQPPKYGKERIHLAKRAAHREGWQSITYLCRGHEVTRLYKTFLATSRLVGGVIRVVIVRFDDGWAAYFCTDPTADVKDILEAVAARWAVEEHFHDVKEVWGAGQQQVRNVWSNIGCWHLNQWLFTLVQLCSWDQEKSSLADRSDRPWDNPERRPSHADRRRKIAREMLEEQFLTVLPRDPEANKLRDLIASVLTLCV
jgi:hypothetical protein